MNFGEKLKEICEDYGVECPTFQVNRRKVEIDFVHTFKSDIPDVEFFRDMILKFIVYGVSKIKYDYHLSNYISKEVVPVIRNIEFIDENGEVIALEKLVDYGVPHYSFLNEVKGYMETKHEFFCEEISSLVEDYEYFLWSETL